jgi:large subunit ribosomal protein L22
MMEAKATHMYARISPRKVKIVCDLIRGKDVRTAEALLAHTPKAGSELVIQVLRSAAANAENNFSMDADKLFVKETYANPGPILKRGMPRARGGYNRIEKRTSHITVVVAEKE